MIDVVVTYEDWEGRTIRRAEQTWTGPHGRFAIELSWGCALSAYQDGPPPKPAYPPTVIGYRLLSVEVLGPADDPDGGGRYLALVDTSAAPVTLIDLGFGPLVVDLGEVTLQWSVEIPTSEALKGPDAHGPD